MANINTFGPRTSRARVATARSARSFNPLSFGNAPLSAAAQVWVIVVLLLMAWAAIFGCRPALAADPGPLDQPPPPQGPLSFDESAKIAIRQSPYFTKSSLEIDIRRMDEADSRFGMVPPLTFRTYYYVNQPSGLSSKPYSLNFTTDPYNPFGSYFVLQAQKLVSQIAVLNHLKVISKGLEHVGKNYIDLDALQKMALYQKDLIALAREKLAYMQNRLSIGTATSLDVKLAQQELEVCQAEQEQIVMSQKRVLAGLLGFIGLKSSQPITLDLRDTRRQVLGNFTPDSAEMGQAKSLSYDLRIFDLQKKVQDYNISLAIAKAFPTILFNTQTPDPLSVTTARGLYVGFGLEIPVWDGFKRIRNISRQKAVLKQIQAQKDSKEDSLEDKWREQMANIQSTAVDLKSSQSREDLAKVKSQQNEVRYQAGEVQLPVMLDSRREVLLSQKETLRRNAMHDKAILELRETSGDLGNTYVDANSWQK